MRRPSGRLAKPIPQRRLLLAAALLNGVLAAGTFWMGMGFYQGEGDILEFREWSWCLCAAPGAILLYYWFGKYLCRQHHGTRRQLLWRGVGWGTLVAFGNVPLTAFLFLSMSALRSRFFWGFSWESPIQTFAEVVAMTLFASPVACFYFAPVAIFCGFCLGLTNSLVVWHGHVAPRQREILRLQGEYPDVPDGALSRWQPTAEQPTDRSLSRVTEGDQPG